MSTHPLTTFVYETFGQQFGDLLLAGYGEEPGGGRRKLYLTELDGGEEVHWIIELTSHRLPYRDEPLVLAALLKLLMSRQIVSTNLEFEMKELLAELQREDDTDTRRQVEAVIVGYAGLLYDKRAGRRATATSEGGCYRLLTGYFRGSKSITGGVLERITDIVYFDSSFISELGEGRITFAGIDFGLLQMTG